MCNSATCPNNKTGIGADFLCNCKKEKYKPKYCKHFDCGWCYKENSKYAQTGCVGTKNCDYFKDVR